MRMNMKPFLTAHWRNLINLTYPVEHPVWEIHPLQECRLHMDFGRLYGGRWAFLNKQQPVCTLVAKGSWVKVFPPKKL
jgi:hypothetical protein